MANFKKADMLYENECTWKRDGGDGPYIGTIDRIKLDRDEGYEVLDFANSYLNSNVSFANENDLHKLEKLIRQKLPSSVVMKSEIIDFLKRNW
ncbi:hypothetical protein [Flavobacterium sp. JAS]|uniref:hypothetical protein n=1 Tax=Flavobacterium sp. JAS TaxID=2897329 RepID=UPI001E2C1D16|nr:hypothetical protein [Flavobacterium sp. JAS]MCD0471777.1 hypothetical protein [Flavobacterium sp. JAS]